MSNFLSFHFLTLSSAAFCSARSTCCLMLDVALFREAMATSRWCSSVVSFDTSFIIPSTSPLWVCLARWSSSPSCRMDPQKRWYKFDLAIFYTNAVCMSQTLYKFSDLFHFSSRGIILCFNTPQFLLRWLVSSLSAHPLQPEQITIT